MPNQKTLRRYLPIAFVAVVGLAGLIAANPSVIFGLLDPAGTLERQRDRNLYQVGSAEDPLTYQEASQLFEQFRNGTSTAGTALVHQDGKNGLPDAFISDLESLFIESRGTDRVAARLINQLAVHRSFDEQVELTLTDSIRPQSGGIHAQPMDTLGRLGTHRSLTDPTLRELLEITSLRGSYPRTALGVLEKTAAPHGLPDWALDRLEEIAELQLGTIRSDAIKVIATAGDKNRARALFNSLENPIQDREAIARALPGDDVPELMAVLLSEDDSDSLRIGALEQIVKKRDQPEVAGQALTYAFTSDHKFLRIAAFTYYSEWGRHHSKFIEVDWTALCTESFADDDPAMQHALWSAFHFVPFDSIQARETFLLRMLEGTRRQQLNALSALSRVDPLSESTQIVIVRLMNSADEEISSRAQVLHERFRPKGTFEGLGSWIAGALLLGLLGLPALTALVFGTYFMAKLFQSVAAHFRQTRTALVTGSWFVVSIGLGFTLFAGVLGLGHGGHITWEIHLLLVAINAVFAGVGWGLAWIVKDRTGQLQQQAT
jgi:hypothetical protein